MTFTVNGIMISWDLNAAWFLKTSWTNYDLYKTQRFFVFTNNAIILEH